MDYENQNNHMKNYEYGFLVHNVFIQLHIWVHITKI
jgi:hypothetical protein